MPATSCHRLLPATAIAGMLQGQPLLQHFEMPTVGISCNQESTQRHRQVAPSPSKKSMAASFPNTLSFLSSTPALVPFDSAMYAHRECAPQIGNHHLSNNSAQAALLAPRCLISFGRLRRVAISLPEHNAMPQLTFCLPFRFIRSPHMILALFLNRFS